jgi:hypothetical protein
MENSKYLTRKELCKFLQAHGFPISMSFLNKISAPSLAEGPPVAAQWGSRPLYLPDQAIAWAQSRLRRPRNSATA